LQNQWVFAAASLVLVTSLSVLSAMEQPDVRDFIRLIPGQVRMDTRSANQIIMEFSESTDTGSSYMGELNKSGIDWRQQFDGLAPHTIKAVEGPTNLVTIETTQECQTTLAHVAVNCDASFIDPEGLPRFYGCAHTGAHLSGDNVLRKLMEYSGNSLWITDSLGHTPLELAASQAVPHLVQTLLQHDRSCGGRYITESDLEQIIKVCELELQNCQHDRFQHRTLAQLQQHVSRLYECIALLQEHEGRFRADQMSLEFVMASKVLVPSQTSCAWCDQLLSKRRSSPQMTHRQKPHQPPAPAQNTRLYQAVQPISPLINGDLLGLEQDAPEYAPLGTLPMGGPPLAMGDRARTLQEQEAIRTLQEQDAIRTSHQQSSTRTLPTRRPENTTPFPVSTAVPAAAVPTSPQPEPQRQMVPFGSWLSQMMPESGSISATSSKDPFVSLFDFTVQEK